MTIDELARELLDCYGSEGQRGLAHLVRRKELEARIEELRERAGCYCVKEGYDAGSFWVPASECARCKHLALRTAELASLEEATK